MRTLIDLSELYQTNPLFSQLSLSEHNFEPVKLKKWWKELPQADKSLACKIEVPEIISDLTQATSDAIFLCKVNRNYKQKRFVTLKKVDDQEKNLHFQEYSFNFVGKEIISENIAQLFSAYILQVEKVPDSGDSHSSDSQNSHPIGLFKVQEKFFDSWIELLEAVMTSFGRSQKLLFQKEEIDKFYSAITEYSFLRMTAFKRIESANLQKLLHKLVSVTVIFENNIYQLYQNTYNSSVISNSTLLDCREIDSGRRDMYSTISSKVSQSDASDSSRGGSKPNESPGKNLNNTEYNIGGRVGLDSFRQNLSSRPSQEMSGPSYSQKGWYEKNIFWQAMNLAPHPSYLQNSFSQKNNSMYPDNQSFLGFEINQFYDGFEMGDLQITFDFADIFLTEYVDVQNDSDLLRETIKQYKRDFAQQNLEYYNGRRFKEKSQYRKGGFAHGRSKYVDEVGNNSTGFFENETTDFYGYRYSQRKVNSFWNKGDDRRIPNFQKEEDSSNFDENMMAPLNKDLYAYPYRPKQSLRRGEKNIYYVKKKSQDSETTNKNEK